MTLLQASEVSPFLSLGVGGCIAVFVIMVWRQDRRGWNARYEEDRVASEERYQSIAMDFRLIVQDNTRAITALTDQLSGGIAECPYREDVKRHRGPIT